MSLWTRNPTPCSCLSSLPLKCNLWPSSVDVSPKFFHRTPQRPKMFQPYLLVLYDNSSNLPAIREVLTFQVPIVILFHTRILLVVTPVAYFSPPSWCKRNVRSFSTRATTDPVWVEKRLSFHVTYHGQIKPGGAHSPRSLVWVRSSFC